MAKKKTQINNENDSGGGGKKQKTPDVNLVVLKIDLHCEGCAGRLVKAVRALDGVETVRIGDSELSKLTVTGNLDPVKLRQKVEEKTKKKVEVITPATKKSNDGAGENKKKQEKQPEKDQKPSKTAGKKGHEKPKELPVTTAVLKVPLHCQGCIRRIHKLVTKTKGYIEMSLDKNKDLVTVKGAIDMKLLVEALQHKLKRAVEIVPVKKDGERKGGGGEKGKGGNDGDGGGSGGEKKGKNKGGGEENNNGGKQELFRMENYGGSMGYPYPQYVYGSGFADYVHAPQLFSDENPNACVVM